MCNGPADVLVVDGFTGNAVLKSMEGTASTVVNLLIDAIKDGGTKGKLGALLLKDQLKGLKDTMNLSKLGGAILFGVKSPVMKTHGATDAEAIYHTLRQTRDILQTDVLDNLEQYFESVHNKE